jgi:hypothetical protein
MDAFGECFLGTGFDDFFGVEANPIIKTRRITEVFQWILVHQRWLMIRSGMVPNIFETIIHCAKSVLSQT